MSYPTENPTPHKSDKLSTRVVSIGSMVLALVAATAGVATIIVTEINNWPVVSLLAAAGFWVLGAYYLVLANDLWNIHWAERPKMREPVQTETERRDDPGSIAA